MLAYFAGGVAAARLGLLPDLLASAKCGTYVFYVLLALVGLGVGGNDKSLALFKQAGGRIVLVPTAVAAGTLLGAAAASLVIDTSLRATLAVGAGFGYYSLSSIIIAPIAGKSLGVMALLSNLCREIITLVFTPVLAKYFGAYAPIAAGGATTMDSTLAVVSKFSGSEYAVIAMCNGVVLTFLVPLLVPLILKVGA
jgi:uncharacterized membrane protein YbjE (DUF340 family)